MFELNDDTIWLAQSNHGLYAGKTGCFPGMREIRDCFALTRWWQCPQTKMLIAGSWLIGSRKGCARMCKLIGTELLIIE